MYQDLELTARYFRSLSHTMDTNTNNWYIPQHVLYCILVIHYNLTFACFKTCSPVIIRKFK